MTSVFVLFISVCMGANCSWLEITEPTFADLQECYSKGYEVGMRMKEELPGSYGQFVCIDELDKEGFKEYLRQNGYMEKNDTPANGTAI